ncbi:MAG TPA: hypothetical protein PLN69_04010 [bacterium]|nr:hypothetical protein [bacterium]
MSKSSVDTDKIVKHIKYTKHWLDKANSNFQDKQFSDGSVVLNLARAELTAAWEEAMQIKAQMVSKIPQKAKSNWKPISSLGLLASGFLIAFLMIKFTPSQVPEPGRIHQVVAPVSIEQTMTEQNIPEEAPAIEEVGTEVVEEQPAVVETSVPVPKKVSVTKKSNAVKIQKTVNQSEPAKVDLKKAVEKTVVAVTVIAEPEVLPYTPVGNSSMRNRSTQKETQKSSGLEQNEIIELFKTAESSLQR